MTLKTVAVNVSAAQSGGTIPLTATVTFTMTAQSGDCRVRLRCGSGYISGAYSAVGSYSITVPSAATTDLFGFYGDGTTGSISIDNIVALAHR